MFVQTKEADLRFVFFFEVSGSSLQLNVGSVKLSDF